MDNLFISGKLFTALYLSKCLAHGVARTNGRGFPNLINQAKEKNVVQAMMLRGMTKGERLKNSIECPDLLAISVYDTKPVHVMSMCSESVEWAVKKRRSGTASPRTPGGSASFG